MTFFFQQETPKIGNYRKGVNVRSKHSCNAKSYKVTITININSQFYAFPVMGKQVFVIWKSEKLVLDLVDL